MDCSAVVLNKLLLERNLDVWAKLKLAFIDPAYSSVYGAIARHYDKYSNLPSFEELEISGRETVLQKTLAVIKLIDEPDINAEVALDALIDRYTQDQAVGLLDKFIDKLPIFDSNEIKQNLNEIVLTLDEKTLTTEGVFSMADIMLFKNQDELEKDRVFLGLNNLFDSTLGGVATQELILIGGERGAGKSITSSNIFANQYECGNSCVMFSIEMVAHEVLERNLAILANVPYMSLKNNNLSKDELLQVIKVRANMFEDADDLVLEYMQKRDRFNFESRLVREKKLKTDNQMIIIDDRALTLTSIDLHLGKLKTRFGDKLKVCVVDYLNQIVVEGGSQFDWQPQIVVSKKLKELARKHKVVMVSPYQIDAQGEARFAKGILDAADIALLMQPHEKEKGAISFKTTKIRGGPPIEFTSPINWETLRILPDSINKPEKQTKIKTVSSKTNEEAKEQIPWE
ncbi:MAG TPA: DnaB-like helicase C-terminal domain-containing protein [Allocoleopsis sp.]